MRIDIFQVFLIAAGVLVTVLSGVFVYREIFPEYKIYQDDYIALENFRSTYTHKPPAQFKTGIKQIVLEREDNGPPRIDRCTSCHVALQIPYFSPTKIAHDINGNVIHDASGKPVLFPNEDYIWSKLDQTIAELRDEKVNQQLAQEGEQSKVKERLKQAEEYEALKIVHVGEYAYDVKKVLSMHPLIGNETRPFEYHSIDEYGCTSCHNGNGRGLTTNKAHGPVFDEQYTIEYEGPEPKFTESDEANDPRFARIFNHKPGAELLFQTEPIFVGPLIQAKCMQCHKSSEMQFSSAKLSIADELTKQQKGFKTLLNSFEKDKENVLALLEIRKRLLQDGYPKTIEYLRNQQTNYTLTSEQIDEYAAQEKYVQSLASGQSDPIRMTDLVLEGINKNLLFFLGSTPLIESLQNTYNSSQDKQSIIDPFLKSHQQDSSAKGALFVKAETIALKEDLIHHARDAEKSFQAVENDPQIIGALKSEVDELTQNFQHGKELYLSQACYACHKITGLARGGVGPELTRIGIQYPWYIKQSMVWPQADVPTSTMPNMRLDHTELENLMSFLLAQKGSNNAVAKITYETDMRSWEAGRKLPWEKPVTPAQMLDLNYGMTVFATEGCAACHRLMGFQSNVGFTIEKNNPSFEELYEEKTWFKKLFPEVIHVSKYDEQLPGSSITAAIDAHAKEIDTRISPDIRSHSILEEIELNHPGTIESFYSNFSYAARSKNHYFDSLIQKDPKNKAEYEKQRAAWKNRVHNVLMMYVQIYGLGRLIGPRPNWSGVYRSDEWLMEHFRNPSSHVPRSIMPVLPFDDTKFYALTYMLDRLATSNRDAVHEIWQHRGFDPAEAFQIHCAQCHGQYMTGNGAVAEWLYPIPKNLRNADFLRNLTKERAIYSIHHGVKGTPMPPWGEVAQDKPPEIMKMNINKPILSEAEISRLVDWMFVSLTGEEVIKENEAVPKWQYGPEDVLRELKSEGGQLKPMPSKTNPPNKNNSAAYLQSFFPSAEGYYASLKPQITPIPKTNISAEVEQVFDVLPSPEDGPDPYHYYIKKEFYTPLNIQSGKHFFLLNCAVCHGTDGDGTGARAAIMQEAKPRMFTDLDWALSRDDMRLLRSIKFGVPGTAMTPWGDQTSALQRMQLVIFIRSLLIDQKRRAEVSKTIYEVFDTALMEVDQARIGESQKILELKNQQREIEKQLAQQERLANDKKAPLQKVVDLYKESLELTQKLKLQTSHDQQYEELKNGIRRQKDIYTNLGSLLISKDVSEDTLNAFIEMIKLNENIYQLDGQQFSVKIPDQLDEKIHTLQKKIFEQLGKQIAELKEKKRKLELTMNAAQYAAEIAALEADITGLQKIQSRLMADIDEALRIAHKMSISFK